MTTFAHLPLETERRLNAEVRGVLHRSQFLARTSTPELVQRVTDLHRHWPDLTPGVVATLAEVGVDPMDPLARMLAEQAVVATADSGGFTTPGDVIDAREEQARNQHREPGIVDRITAPIRPLVRGAFTAFETARTELVSRPLTGILTGIQDPDLSIADAYAMSTPSTGALAFQQWRETGEVDLGDGFFPGGEVFDRQQELRDRLTLGGEWVSPGRAVANVVSEPGTKPFTLLSALVDGAAALFLDPASWATGGAAKVMQARRVFGAPTGLIPGIRNTTAQDEAMQWLVGTDVGRKMTSWLSRQSDPYEIWTTLRKEVDRETATALARSTSEREVIDVLSPRLGVSIHTRPVGSAVGRGLARLAGDELGEVAGIGVHLRRKVADVRMLGWMPDSRGLNPADLNASLETLDRYLQTVQMGRGERARWMRRAFELEEGDVAGLLDLVEDVTADTTARILDEASIPAAIQPREGTIQPTGPIRPRDQASLSAARHIARVFRRDTEQMRAYWSSEVARAVPGWDPMGAIWDDMDMLDTLASIGVMVDGPLVREAIDWSTQPHLVSELLNHHIPLPDAQLVRRHLGTYADFVRALGPVGTPFRKTFEGVNDLMAAGMSTVWKPLVLLRGAYILRVTGEEQVRMGAAGLDSAFRHPVSYIAWLMGRKGQLDVKGNPLADAEEFVGILQRRGGGWVGQPPRAIRTGDRIPLAKADVAQGSLPRGQYVDGWAQEFSKLVNDPVASYLARHGRDDTHAWLWSSAGVRYRRMLSQTPHMRPVWNNPDAARSYVDSVWVRLHELAGGRVEAGHLGYNVIAPGHPDLVAAIASGKLGEASIRGVNAAVDPTSARAFRRSLDGYFDLAPEEVSAARLFTRAKRDDAQVYLERLDRAVSLAADWIMSKPTNVLSRSITWKQYYWQEVTRAAGFATREVQRQVLATARKANLSRDQIRDLTHAIEAGAGSNIASLDLLDDIGKAGATKNTRQLLYDLTERGQFSDATAAAIPFAEAWREIGQSWGRLIRQRPQVLRRGQQVVEGARGSGFFFTDDYGNESFAYPGGRFVSRAVMGSDLARKAATAAAPIPFVGSAAVAGLGVAGAFMDPQPAEFDLTGSVTGLNLFAGSVLPGLGPVVTMPASQLLPDVPSLEWVRDNLIFPFGEPDVEGGIVEAALPAWMQKLRTAFIGSPESDRLYANSVLDTARALMATGEYSTQSPAEIERLLTDAKRRARSIWAIRGAAQFTLPTGPSVRWSVQDVQQQWWPFQVVVSEYHRLIQAHGHDGAVDTFLHRFGPDNLLLLQAGSRENVPSPTTRDAGRWMHDNPDVVRDYHLTAGLVAPDDPLGEFDHRLFVEQFAQGRRQQLTPQQMVWLSNNLLGSLAYRWAVSRIGEEGDPESVALRSATRAMLVQTYPGYLTAVGVADRVDLDQQLAELERMATDPRLEDNPAVGALREYLEARSAAQREVAMFATRSTSFTSSAETRYVRDWLRDVGQRLVEQTPEFRAVWDRVLSRELGEDEPAAGTLDGLGVVA